MPRRVRQRPSLFSPAGDLIRRVSNEKARLRRRLVLGGFLAVIIFIIYSTTHSTYGIPRLIRLEMEKKAAAHAVLRQTSVLIDTARKRSLLEHDRAYIEHLARTQYHMAYPYETIYRFRDQ